MAELDVMLSETLKRAATPGDPTGVADAIRARVAAGDTGTPASTSGFGPRRWWGLWLSLAVLVSLAIGGALAFGVPALTPPTTTAVATASSTPKVSLTPTPTPSPTPTASPSPTPTPTAIPTEEPAPVPPPPPPPADTTPPVVVSANSSAIFGSNGSMPTISATVTDDRGVAAVGLSWSGVLAGSASMSPAWTYVLTVPPGTPGGTIQFTVIAVDSAGNSSAPYVFDVPVTF
jgi:outer membrane biosynthesis protein TonB